MNSFGIYNTNTNVDLGTISFLVLQGAETKMSNIDFITSDPNVKVYGEIDAIPPLIMILFRSLWYL